MRRTRWHALLCLLALLLCLGLPAQAVEDGRLMTPDDLKALQPAWERFLNELADLLVARGLLAPQQREDWLMAQLGDYMLNGGYGMIAAMYTPDLLDWVRPQDQMRYLSREAAGGTLSVRTLSAYDPRDADYPGLLLEAGLTGTDSLPVACRFRWTCQEGGFLIYDALSEKWTDMGSRHTNDGRPAYWSDQPPAPGEEGQRSILIEILDPADDTLVLGSAVLVLTPGEGGWTIGADALQANE